MSLVNLLDWAVLAVSFFNTLSLLWLGLMVLTVGNRRSAGTWLTGAGLLLGALFFTSHTAILGRGLAQTGLGMNFWWWVSWTPAVVAPLAWYGAMLWHAGLRPLHRMALPLIFLLSVLVGVLVLVANPLPSYHYVAGRWLADTPSIFGVPVLIITYILYSLSCYLLPLDLLARPAPAANPLMARSRERARPWLIGASLAMLLAGGMLTWTALWALYASPIPTLKNPLVVLQVKLFDVAVETLIALAVTLLGRAIVAYEVFTGRSLPRDRFYYQWRSTVILAAGFGSAAAFSLVSGLRPIYGLMLATTLMTVFYALYSARSFQEREAFMSRLRPFVASQNLYAQLTEPAPVPNSGAQPLFETLCVEILSTSAAALVPTGALSTLAGPPLTYPRDAKLSPPPVEQWHGRFSAGQRCLPVEAAPLAWAVPLWNTRDLGGVLYLGEKISGSPYNEEEIEVAQAAGERLLDMLAGSEMARVSVELLRQRISQARVMEGQSRRVLHDEVLPELHTAILYLNSQSAGSLEMGQAVETLSGAHRRISDLLRQAAPAAPLCLAEGGLVAALQSLLAGDFAHEFDVVDWEINPAAELTVRGLPDFKAEVIYFGARELVRNAARYARGAERQTQVRLIIRLQACAETTCLIVEDNGVGLQANETTGSGSGLRIHSAMLAAVGASLQVISLPAGGTRGSILF